VCYVNPDSVSFSFVSSVSALIPSTFLHLPGLFSLSYFSLFVKLRRGSNATHF
jgi:hypothetical protein